MSEGFRRYAEQQHAEASARLGYTVDFARGGMQAALLANGGALIGLFSLIAPHRDLAAKLSGSGLAFSLALTLTLCAWLSATVSQDRFQIAATMAGWNAELQADGLEPAHDISLTMKIGNLAMYSAYAFVVASFAAFITGSMLALGALAS